MSRGSILKSILVWGFFSSIVSAQDFNVHGRFEGFFDNREYFNQYISPQSIFGTRAWLGAGINYKEQHSLQLGITAMYEFGSTGDPIKPEPVIYYNHRQKYHELYFGLFPRYNLIQLPRILLNDTLFYFRPNVEGIYLRFHSGKAFQSIWLDWTSRQTENRRETFLLGGSGLLNFRNWFYFHHFVMYHYAGPSVRIPDDQIRDNGGLIAGLGYHLTPGTTFDTLYIKTAFALSYDQHRSIYDMRFYGGSLSEIAIEYKGFGINETFYIGDGQVQLMGDQFYTSELYSRTDVYWNPFKSDYINWKIQFSFHYTPGTLDWSQIFLISLDLNKHWKLAARPVKNVIE